MQLQHIELKDLSISPLNVRKFGAKSVDDLMPSIQAHGVIQPLLVRANNEGFEVVAGQRRFHALQKISDSSDSNENAEPVPCLIMENGDDAKAVEASLAENIARLPMDEIDQYKAFAVLINQGRDVSGIADQFGITERLVKQRLAIANLIPPLLTAYRKDDVDPASLRLLTMATKAQQKAWLVLLKSDDEYAPEGYQLKCWLFGGAEITVDAALFDLSAYDGNIISDLFDEKRYFDDVAKFWALQNTAIATSRDSYLADGWSDVIIWEFGQYFPSYDYVDTAKEDGGKVYIVPANNGEVAIYEGQLSRDDIKKRDRAADGNVETTKSKAELTKPMQNYLNVHRHAAVRLNLLGDQGLALRLAAAQLICGSSLWEVHADPQKTANEAIESSLAENKAQAQFHEHRAGVFALLGMPDGDSETLVPRKSDWNVSRDLHSIFAKLIELDDEAVSTILTFVVAETLSSGSVLVEALGQKLNVDMIKYWQADECFFSLLRDKATINAMLKETAGKAVADKHITSTAKVQKQLMRDAQSAKSGKDTPDWEPRYGEFPMRAYTKQGGIAAIDEWKAVQKHYR